jgi:hypothetical protein
MISPAFVLRTDTIASVPALTFFKAKESVLTDALIALAAVAFPADHSASTAGASLERAGATFSATNVLPVDAICCTTERMVWVADWIVSMTRAPTLDVTDASGGRTDAIRVAAECRCLVAVAMT